jgi:hypothetical protein
MKNRPRAETGVMQFDNDWPGIFIRGDNAGILAMYLREVLASSQADPITQLQVEGLASLLASCDVRSNPERQFASDFIGPCDCCRDGGCSNGCGCRMAPDDEDEEEDTPS